MLPRVAVIAAGLLGFACSSARIQQPTLLRVEPDALADSAAVGSATPRVLAVALLNEGAGELAWTAQVSHSSPWLTIAPAKGIVAQTLPPTIQANPSGLAVGIYRDTLVFQGGSATVPVPVTFRVY